jgi:hypothetical protein
MFLGTEIVFIPFKYSTWPGKIDCFLECVQTVTYRLSRTTPPSRIHTPSHTQTHTRTQSHKESEELRADVDKSVKENERLVAFLFPIPSP